MAIPQFLRDLLTASGPSGYEAPAAEVWRAHARTYASEVTNDTMGSSVAWLPGSDGADARNIGLVGHIDEIGLVVSHVADEGVLRFQTIGGWDAHVLVGQRVTIQSSSGPVPGVVGRKPIHLLEEDERKQVAKIDAMYIDIGASDKDDAKRMVAVGDPAVIAAEPYELAHG